MVFDDSPAVGREQVKTLAGKLQEHAPLNWCCWG